MENKNKMIMVLGMMAFLPNGDNYAAAPLIINIAKDLNLTVSVAAMSVTLFVGIIAAIFISKFEARKMQCYYTEAK